MPGTSSSSLGSNQEEPDIQQAQQFYSLSFLKISPFIAGHSKIFLKFMNLDFHPMVETLMFGDMLIPKVRPL